MLRVVLTVDCERFISFKQGNPRWNHIERLKGKLNNAIKRIRYNEKGFDLVYSTLKKENFPCTIMLVESLFKKPSHEKFIEIGTHTKNHLPLTLVSDETLKKEIKNKWKVKSITAPMWMVEDKKNPDRIFKLLKSQGYTHTVYRGANDGIRHFHYNAVKMPVKRAGLTLVHVSDFFEGNSSLREINNIKQNILKNLDNRGVYLLTTHEFTHKNNKNLLNLIYFLKSLEKQKKIKILSLKKIK